MINRVRSKRILAWSGQLLLVLALWIGITSWQQKDLLQDTALVPGFILTTVEGKVLRLEEIQAERTLLYFFAPWCSICKLSIGNLNELLDTDDSLAVIAIALSYQSPAEVTEFVGDQQLDVPVLLGTHQTLSDYNIEMFPTYYVLDAEKRVLSKSVGYSTELGLKTRSWW